MTDQTAFSIQTAETKKWFEKACEQQALRMTAEASEDSLRAKVAQLEAVIERVRKAKLLIDDFEGVIDKQTYDEHHKNDFDTPPDCELYITITAKEEGLLTKAASELTGALLDLSRP